MYIMFMSKKNRIRNSIFSINDFASDFLDNKTEKVDNDLIFSNELFLNRFTHIEMHEILHKVGLFVHLEKLGFRNIEVEIFSDSNSIHYLRVYDHKGNNRNVLVDLRLCDKRFFPKKIQIPILNPYYDVFSIEWLESQDPYSETFKQNRPQLPGQTRPGLGCLKYLMAMMDQASDSITKDGFLDVPDHFHLAVMYSRNFKFFNPEKEGEMRSLLRDFTKYTLADISWGVITESIFEKNTGSPFIYTPSEEIFPLSGRMKKYFSNPAYEKIMKKAMKTHYTLDIDLMEKKKKIILENHNIREL
jgi:hypothetical protein